MARKTIRLEDLPPEARQEIERKMDGEANEKRLGRLLDSKRVRDALVKVPEDRALAIFQQVLRSTRVDDGGVA